MLRVELNRRPTGDWVIVGHADSTVPDGHRFLESHMPYVKTAKNRPALDFLRHIASTYETPTGGGYRFIIPAQDAAAVRYNPISRPGEPERATASEAVPEAAQRTVDYHHIATERPDQDQQTGLGQVKVRQ